jgi:hypothetical protein
MYADFKANADGLFYLNPSASIPQRLIFEEDSSTVKILIIFAVGL